ncbi:hypothetical protein C8J56DRAFT_769474 [Mycena floridula]|nr:hypothetical protein C8J56DRAFT_769474 [Mycena floridula]
MARGVAIHRSLQETVIRMNTDGFPSNYIFELTRVSERSQQRIMHRFRNTGQVHKAPTGLPHGRPRHLSTEEVMIILGIATDEERYDTYLDEIREELREKTGRDISESTAWRYLKRSGHTMKKVRPFHIKFCNALIILPCR